MRIAEISRKTKETDIELKLDLDGSGKVKIDTGIGFFNHMLTAFAVHSGIDLSVVCRGDLEVDGHHTVEDIGIVLGKAIGYCQIRLLLYPYGRSVGVLFSRYQRQTVYSVQCRFS